VCDEWERDRPGVLSDLFFLGLLTRAGTFKESEHPRDPTGKFGSGGGGGEKPAPAKGKGGPAKKPAPAKGKGAPAPVPAAGPPKVGKDAVVRGTGGVVTHLGDDVPRTDTLHPANEGLPVHLREPAKSLPAGQRRAVEGYTAENYKEINANLRDGRDISPQMAAARDDVRAAIQAQQPFPEPVLAWRGLRVEDPKAAADLTNRLRDLLLTGQPLTMRGVVSTTLDPSIATTGSFGADQAGGFTFEIRARKGLYVDEVSANEGERELLLDHGSKFRVVAIKEVEAPVGYGRTGKRKMIQLEHIL